MSGTMQGNLVHIVSGHNDYFFINWQLAGQNEDGNYSSINWQAYFHFDNDDAQLDNGVAASNVGTLWSNGGRVYNYAGNFATRNLGLASGSFNIGHDGNGNQSVNFNGGIDVYQSGRSSGSQWWGLPGLYQEVAYNDIHFLNITDVSFQVYVAVNRTANLLQLSIDGGGWTTYYGSNFGSVTVQVGSQSNPIASGQNHTVVVRVRRASNGNITDSGTYNVATAVQNNFFDIGDY